MTYLINLLVIPLFCLGINDPGKNPGSSQDLAKALNPDCWYNWSVYDEQNLNDPKFTPMLWRVNEGNLKQSVRLATQYKGKTWLVYNEPEGSDQANVDYVTGAKWFDRVYEQIKEVDPSAKIACCGVMLRSEGMYWLNGFYDNVIHKPDVWHIHIYINSPKLSDWLAFYNWFINWNVNHANLPIYVTETCAMYQEQDDQIELLKSLLTYRHPLLKAVYWFSAYPEKIVPDWKCNLLNADGSINALGEVFKNRPLPNKLTPKPEPPTLTPTPTDPPTLTPTSTFTLTPQPTITIFPWKSPTPTSTPTPTITPIPTLDETTAILSIPEPVIKIFLPLIQN